MKKAIGCLGLIAFLACGEPIDPVQSVFADLPVGFPLPEVPASNKLTLHRIELGRRLFFDPALSLDSTISCASCHKPELAFADNLAISPGIEGRKALRNSPTLINAAYLDKINRDGGVPTLDLQPIVPIEDENEMGHRIADLAIQLNEDKSYSRLARKAYGTNMTPFVITRSLASFVRTLVSTNAPYDRFVGGDQMALSETQMRGLALFESDRLKCSTCHQGFNFTSQGFENNGTYLDYKDSGRQRVTLENSDIGKFKVPTLRNVAITAPYMHDGQMQTLEEVIDHYNEGGSGHENQSPHIKPLNLTAQEKRDLISFLEALTEERFQPTGSPE